MANNKYENFIETIFPEFVDALKSENLDYNFKFELADRFDDVLKSEDDEILYLDKLTPREWLLFTYGQLCYSGIESKEIKNALFYFANNIRVRKGLPVELTQEEKKSKEDYEKWLQEGGDDQLYEPDNDLNEIFESECYDDRYIDDSYDDLPF